MDKNSKEIPLNVRKFLKEFNEFHGGGENNKNIQEDTKENTKGDNKIKIDSFAKFILKNWEIYLEPFCLKYILREIEISKSEKSSVLALLINEAAFQTAFNSQSPDKPIDYEVSSRIFTSGYDNEVRWRDILATLGKELPRVFLEIRTKTWYTGKIKNESSFSKHFL